MHLVAIGGKTRNKIESSSNTAGCFEKPIQTARVSILDSKHEVVDLETGIVVVQPRLQFSLGEHSSRRVLGVGAEEIAVPLGAKNFLIPLQHVDAQVDHWHLAEVVQERLDRDE